MSTTRIVGSLAEFQALKPRWDALLAQAAGANTFLSHEWLFAWWTGYRPVADLRLVLCEEGDALIGVAPLMARVERRFGVPARALRFVGDGTAETDHMDFVLRAEGRERILRTLLGALAADPAWDVAHFDQVPADSPTVSVLEAWARGQGFWVERTQAPSLLRRLPPDFDTLLASLQSRFRTTVRSSRRKLEQKYRVAFGEHTDPGEIPAALETLYANHASRWAAKGQAGVFVDEGRRRFYAALTPALQARGWLRFFFLKLDDRVVAQEYCFEYDGTVFLLQEGFDYAHADENVGHALRARVLERLIEEKKHTYDFLAGVSRHKQLWADGDRPDVRLAVARRRLRAGLYHHAPGWVAHAKETARSRLPPQVFQALKRVNQVLNQARNR